MGYDVLTFVITEKLAEGREKLKDDGQNVSLWLSALATFCGHLAKKYQGIELSALLQYLVGWCRLTL
jgi:THO complex subunit 2